MSLFNLLEHSTPFLLSTVFVFGLIVGSFLNVVIHRLPKMMQKEWREDCCEFLEIDNNNQDDKKTYNLISPRSACPGCGHKITALENVPLISYLFLRGKCSECSAHISLRYPAIELISGLTSVTAAWFYGFSAETFLIMILSWSLICLTMIDYEEQLLPDGITLPILWLGIFCNYFDLFTDLESSVLGAIFGYLAFWSVYILFKVATGKEGMGHGDFKLLSMLGAWLGWQMLPLVIILSSIVGALIGIALLVFTSHNKSKPIPFGPYIAIAGWIAIFWGNQLTEQYLGWSNLG